MVVFGDSSEPWSVGRGGAKRWLHCHILDVDGLSDEQRAELHTWLAERGVEHDGWLLVTRDANGEHRLHVGSGVVDVALSDLPVWLQRPELPKAQSTPKKATRSAPAKADS